MDAVELFGTIQLLFNNVPGPAADTRQPLRLSEFLLFSMQCFLGALAVDDIAEQQNNQKSLDQQKAGKSKDLPAVNLPR